MIILIKCLDAHVDVDIKIAWLGAGVSPLEESVMTLLYPLLRPRVPYRLSATCSYKNGG